MIQEGRVDVATKGRDRSEQEPALWPAAPETVLLARRRAATLLDADRRVSSVTRADVLLVVSELVSNAIRHGVGPVEFDIDVRPGRVHVEVGDQGPSRPEPARRPAATSQNGRGLLIVEAIASAWGVTAQGPGKRVWADIDVPQR
jgi:anti-sigma regulatory factor (Ser/Thr protein kinase)